MLLNRKNFMLHLPWLVVFAIGTAAAMAWYLVAAWRGPRWPGGSSWPGLVFGGLGGLIIVFECLIWLRKKYRGVRYLLGLPLGRAHLWMRCHIWLGLLCFPLLLLHSGFHFGGFLAVVLFGLLCLVLASGVFGLVLQQSLPTYLLEVVPEETIFSQIDEVSRRLVAEADALVLTTCGRGDGTLAKAHNEFVLSQRDDPTKTIIGASRSMRNFKGTLYEVELPEQPFPNADLLRDRYQAEIRDFLSQGRSVASPVSAEPTAKKFFEQLRGSLISEARASVDALEEWCRQRRQLDRQRRIHWWLHVWRAVHMPLSAALLLLMAWHIVVAFEYSGILSVPWSIFAIAVTVLLVLAAWRGLVLKSRSLWLGTHKR